MDLRVVYFHPVALSSQSSFFNNIEARGTFRCSVERFARQFNQRWCVVLFFVWSVFTVLLEVRVKPKPVKEIFKVTT